MTKRWKPWFDHTIKQPVMAPETRPGKGYVSLKDFERAESALQRINSFDSDPSNHHKDASFCGICVAREYFESKKKAGT